MIFPETDVYYEIGSCNSVASLIMSKILTGERISVVSFEPEGGNIYATWINMQLNQVYNMVLIPIALSDKNALQRFYLCSKMAIPGQGGHSLNKRLSRVEYWLPSLKLDKAVKLFSLPYPTLVSIDVKGHEEAVLRGMKEVLYEKRVRCLVVEVWNQHHSYVRVDRLMSEYGYKLDGYKQIGDGRLLCYIPD